MCTVNLPINNLPAPHDGLSTYIDAINRIPLLTEQQETALAIQYREQGDLKAAQQLVLAHLRYVVKIARGFQGYGLAFADLIQEGTVGLMKAVKRFDPSVKVRLVTFAMHWIKAEMHEFVIRNWRIVKVATTKAQRKLFFNLRSAKNRLGWFSADEVEMVANDLGVKPQEVLEMEQRLYAHDVAFDAPEDDDESFLAPCYRIESTDNPAVSIMAGDAGTHALAQGLEDLDERSRHIVQSRWLNEEKVGLKELAQQYDVSIERVRQIEKAALLKLRKLMQST